MRGKRYWMSAAAMGMSIFLFGCSAAFVPVENSSEASMESSEQETTQMESRPLYQPVPESLRQQMIEDLESFDQDHSYKDMDQEKAASCGGEIKDAYDFIGRETEDGYGYVLAFRNSDANPLEGLSIYSIDDVIEAERWNEAENVFERVYTFENIHEIYYTEAKDVLFFVPNDLEEPEELRKAFEHRFCGEEEGVKYLESVKERGVRMSAPENGGYLAVRRFVNGSLLEEYIPLTVEQEKEIARSEEVIDPEVYGANGIEYAASQEIYEEEDVDPDLTTAPALKLAEEVCMFETAGPEDVSGLVSAEMTVYHDRGEDVDGEQADTAVISETLDDPEQLKALEAILSGAAAGEEKSCPYDGILTLTKEDGTKVTISLASDGCDTMVFGSYSFYQAAEGEVKKVWDMFPEAEKSKKDQEQIRVES